MVRPSQPSPKSSQLIYNALLKGPICLQDWRSIGLGSRSTMHKCLKFFVKEGLIKKRREGHKVLHELEPLENDDGSATAIAFLWDKYLIKHSRKERRQSRRWMVKIHRKLRKISEAIESPESQEFLGILKEVYPEEWSKLPPLHYLGSLLLHYKEGRLCPECLKKKRIRYAVFRDGENICPECGLVISEDRLVPKKKFQPLFGEEFE